MSCPACQTTAVRLRELEDELDAWRATEVAAVETEAAALRLIRWQQRLGGMRVIPVRALIVLADAKGRIVSFDHVARLGGKSPDELIAPRALASNTVCHARRALRTIGLGAAIVTIRQYGFQMPPERARQLRTLMGDFEGAEP